MSIHPGSTIPEKIMRIKLRGVTTEFLSSIPTLKHHFDIVSDIPFGSIYGIFILAFYLTFFLGYTLTFYSIWHYIWHLFWHTLWHVFWYSFWHVFTFFLAFFPAHILTSFQACILAFFLASILTWVLAFLDGFKSHSIHVLLLDAFCRATMGYGWSICWTLSDWFWFIYSPEAVG